MSDGISYTMRMENVVRKVVDGAKALHQCWRVGG